MKNVLSVLALLTTFTSPLLFAQSGSEPMLTKGTKELALSGTIEIPEFEEIDFDIDASFGYFVKDGWEIGFRTLGADTGGIERFSLSGFTEYNFNRSTNIVPFVGAAVGIADVNFNGFDNIDFDSTLRPSDGNSTVFGFQGGIKWFLTPYMAISTSIGFDVSSDDIYLADNSFQDSLTRFRIGLRYYF
jgi:hypothetical protein